MAKLNEQPPAPPVESIDALKRRFIRQNREIARVNSTQSQRIRNLETEISRLVAENISLREQAIAAQAEAERWRAASNINREIIDLRDRLQRKVDEVGELIGEMGRIPEKVARKGKRKSRLAGVGERTSSTTEQEWRHRLSVREAIAAEAELNDGKLPAIREDKLFPRRTLENAELAALREEAALQQASESPELGPPPVAHFDVVGESTGLDSARTSEDDIASEDVMQLPSMLERRRKRRTSALLQTQPEPDPIEQASEPSLQQPDVPTQAPQQLLKSGAKRKLDVSELDAPSLPQSSSGNDDFVFQRRQEISNASSTSGKRSSRFTRPPGRENQTVLEPAAPSPHKPGAVARRILAPKSTNSPTKRRVHVSEKLKDEREEQPMQDMVRHQRRNDPPPPIDTENVAQVMDVQSDQEKNLPPKTPADQADGILSPLSTDPSARNTNVATEAAILNSVEDVLNGSIGRGSRRARPAVSYAEPNLRDKMRRPGKELVGAVEGLEKTKDNSVSTRQSSVDRARSEDVKTNDDQCRLIKIKEERDSAADERWKELPMRKKEEPTSPLKDKERKERTSSDITDRAEEHIAADGLDKAVDRLSIFDPPMSSPMEGSENASTEDGHKVPSTARRKTSTSSLSTRRHSVQPSSTRETTNDAQATVQGRTSDRKSSVVRAAPPRPGSSASSRSERMASIAGDIKPSNSVASNLKVGEPAHGEAGTNTSTRAERTLNRRRSMMV